MPAPRLTSLALATTLGGCLPPPKDDPASDSETSSETPDPTIIPTQSADLTVWLEANTYTSWPAESRPHASDGPLFGTVRTFLNPTLLDSLTLDAPEHPIGAATIKELYGTSETIQGYSVMVKVAAGSTGDAWYWFETYQDRLYADARGASLCVDCHATGSAFILTRFPLQ